MPSIQTKDVPPEVHSVLRRRASEAGQSLQEYLLARLTADAARETVEEVLARVAQRSGGSLPPAFAVDVLREERQQR